MMYLTDWGALLLLAVVILIVWLMIIFQVRSYEFEELGEVHEPNESHQGG